MSEMTKYALAVIASLSLLIVGPFSVVTLDAATSPPKSRVHITVYYASVRISGSVVPLAIEIDNIGAKPIKMSTHLTVMVKPRRISTDGRTFKKAKSSAVHSKPRMDSVYRAELSLSVPVKIRQEWVSPNKAFMIGSHKIAEQTIPPGKSVLSKVNLPSRLFTTGKNFILGSLKCNGKVVAVSKKPMLSKPGS